MVSHLAQRTGFQRPPGVRCQVGTEVLIDGGQKHEVAEVEGGIIWLFSEPSQHPAEAVDSHLHLIEGHRFLVSAKVGEEGMMLFAIICSAFIPSGRIH